MRSSPNFAWENKEEHGISQWILTIWVTRRYSLMQVRLIVQIGVFMALNLKNKHIKAK